MSNKTYEHIRPDLQEWPIYEFSENRDEFIQKLIDFVLMKFASSKRDLLELLEKTVYLERQRVKFHPWRVDPGDEKEYWNSIAKEINNAKSSSNPDLQYVKLLKRLIHRYSEEIIGHFVPKTHLLARKLLTAFFKRLFSNGWGRGHKGIWGSKEELFKKFKVDGFVDETRSLFDKGTVIIVPTHYSNLDSIMIAYAIDRVVGLPAFSYGAGLNLYDYELLAYYMNRLGAYRVDRRKKNPVYLETLKSMASLSISEGLNHIFFPGGTRSRSGAIEDKLKYGLLNSAIDSQRHCLLNNIDNKVFIIPLAIGYHFVLEADSLIDQHLKGLGRERFQIRRKKSSPIRTILRFIRKLRREDSEVYLSFGQPMDVLGNRVDSSGNSYDSRGKELDIKSYFSFNEGTNVDTQRESVYTRKLAERIIKSFKKESTVLASHLLAYACFRALMKQDPNYDLFDVLKLKPKQINIELEVVTKEINKIISLPGIKLSQECQNGPETVIKEGLKQVGIYHRDAVIKWKQKQKTLTTDNLRLLFYYHNKLIHLESMNNMDTL